MQLVPFWWCTANPSSKCHKLVIESCTNCSASYLGVETSDRGATVFKKSILRVVEGPEHFENSGRAEKSTKRGRKDDQLNALIDSAIDLLPCSYGVHSPANQDIISPEQISLPLLLIDGPIWWI